MEKNTKVLNIDHKIDRLKKQKARIQVQQAVLFMKEAEKIFQDGFAPDIALTVLSDWTTAPEPKKKEWENRAHSFRPASMQRAQRKTQTRDPAHIETRTHEEG